MHSAAFLGDVPPVAASQCLSHMMRTSMWGAHASSVMQLIIDAPSTHWSQSNAITQDTLHLSSHLSAQVSRCRAYIESLETKLAGQQEYVSGLEGRLQADLARVAPLLGQGLDDLSAAQLSSLVRVHEDGARRARAMLVSHR